MNNSAQPQAKETITATIYTNEQLINMPEKIAAQMLSAEQIYDRIRLLAEMEAAAYVKRNERPPEFNKPPENSKAAQRAQKQDWY